jgi:hypothetical protein
MNFLQQIAPRFRIQFVGSGEPIERGSVSVYRLLILRSPGSRVLG